MRILFHCSLSLSHTVQQTNLSHPFHLHGTAFHVIGMGRSPDANIKKINLKHALDWDRKGLLHRQFGKPPLKDTIAVPNNGYVVLRFRADNPGKKMNISEIAFFLWHLAENALNQLLISRRFPSSQIGFWLFHCHFLMHILIGMNLVVHIGTKADLPPVPHNFPKCGHHLPSIQPPKKHY